MVLERRVEIPSDAPASLDGKALWGFQKTGVEWLWDRFKDSPGAILADEMGLGKTATSLIATEHITDSPKLIVATKGMRRVWQDEAAYWLNADPAGVLLADHDGYSDMGFVRDHEFVIVTWNGLRKGSPPKKKNKPRQKGWLNRIEWGAVLMDEAHRIKNRKAQQSDSMKQIQTPHKLEITGQPIVNQPAEIWSLLNYIDKKEFSSYWQFFEKFVYAIPNVFGGYEIIGVRQDTIDELREILRRFIIRRTIKEVFPDITEPRLQTIFVGLERSQLRAYEQMKNEMIALLDDGQLLESPTVLSQLARLRQLAISQGAYTNDLGAPAPKLDLTMEMLEERRGLGTVVATGFRWPIEAMKVRLKKAKMSYVEIHGGIDEEDRYNNVQKFQKGEADVILITFATGGESWTLTRADTMIFLDRPWSPREMEQTQKRLRYHLQENVVHIIFLEAEDTVEARVAEVLRNKGVIFNQMFRKFSDLKPLL